MRYYRFPAMGTTVEAWLDHSEDGATLEKWFKLVEAECSRFRPDSALSKLNNDLQAKIRVGGILGEVLSQASDALVKSNGLVDASTGSALIAWGYNRSFEEGLPDHPQPPNTIIRTKWSYQSGCLHRGEGAHLDLGGTAKGWACDRAIEYGLASVVSAGGDINSSQDDTVVPIFDPWGEVVTTLMLGRGGLATSSQTRRRWKAGETTVSHLIDPRTMAPTTSPILSATAIADTAHDAEVAAKTILLLGEDGLAWADQADWVDSSLVVWADGSVYGTSGLKVAV